MNRPVRIKNPTTILWWMYSGTGVTQTTQFMVMPFIALYMATKTGATPGIVGLAVGMNSLTTTFLSFLGGSFADKFGRRPLMVSGMLMNVVAMTGFAMAHSVLAFFTVSFLTGLSRALFGPASQAMMTDVTKPADRARAFNMTYWMNNIGASLGPVLGGAFGTVGGGATFYAAAFVSLLYALVVLVLFPDTHGQNLSSKRRTTVKQTLDTIKIDRSLFIFILAIILTNIGYSQFDTTLPQIMQSTMGTGVASRDYSYIFAATGVEVVLLQFLFNRLANFFSDAYSMVISQVVYALSFVGFGLSHSFTQILLWSIVLTFGEMVFAPRSAQFISMIADEQMVGAYFGAFSFGRLGYFIGPAIGGVILHHFGGTSLFFIMSLTALVASPMYQWSYLISKRVP